MGLSINTKTVPQTVFLLLQLVDPSTFSPLYPFSWQQQSYRVDLVSKLPCSQPTWRAWVQSKLSPRRAVIQGASGSPLWAENGAQERHAAKGAKEIYLDIIYLYFKTVSGPWVPISVFLEAAAGAGSTAWNDQSSAKGLHQWPRGAAALEAVRDPVWISRWIRRALESSMSRRTGNLSVKKCHMPKTPKGRSFGCRADSDKARSCKPRHWLPPALGPFQLRFHKHATQQAVKNTVGKT